MKNKVIIVILGIIFIIGLFVISGVMKRQENFQTQNQRNEEEIMSVLEILSENFEEEVLKSDQTVLVDFYADWCGPCKMIAPIVEQVAKETEDVKVCRMNIDEAQDLAVEYGIMSIPTLVVMKNGKEAKRSVGVIGKEEILEMLK